jgi:hypothetical protein
MEEPVNNDNLKGDEERIKRFFIKEDLSKEETIIKAQLK